MEQHPLSEGLLGRPLENIGRATTFSEESFANLRGKDANLRAGFRHRALRRAQEICGQEQAQTEDSFATDCSRLLHDGFPIQIRVAPHQLRHVTNPSQLAPEMFGNGRMNLHARWPQAFLQVSLVHVRHFGDVPRTGKTLDRDFSNGLQSDPIHQHGFQDAPAIRGQDGPDANKAQRRWCWKDRRTGINSHTTFQLTGNRQRIVA
jgi:hypothetical protein